MLPWFNQIEVWRWVKHKINQLPFVPTSFEELKREIQRLWDQMDPKTFHPEVERLTYVIKVKGKATCTLVIFFNFR
ncbi:hypothetical protein CJF32_00011129 [Rutstroemia sp. NJR-2017a WRK4]|nr:hypothetical protein CJF32_00011129 [Rutstroemia sp. NJR-2017a WRK4]